MDLLTKSGIISFQDAALPLVSAAISHLWQNLSEERKTILWQAWLQDTSPPGSSVTYSNGSVHDSGVDSHSLFSTPEEVSRLVGGVGRIIGNDFSLPHSQAWNHQTCTHEPRLMCPLGLG